MGSQAVTKKKHAQDGIVYEVSMIRGEQGLTAAIEILSVDGAPPDKRSFIGTLIPWGEDNGLRRSGVQGQG